MFERIRPYDDAQVTGAMRRIASDTRLKIIGNCLLPGSDPDGLIDVLNSVKGVDDFQSKVMSHAVDGIVSSTTSGLTYSGLEWFRSRSDGTVPAYLLLSNHRDIVLDPAFIQIIMYHNSLPQTEIAVGDNLVGDPFVEDLMRSNRMIKVTRGITSVELYDSSMELSCYIRSRLEEGRRSIWIAHRQGRAKDGNDVSERGLIKMLDLSAGGGFADSYDRLHILPVSVSYEYESCDLQKCIEHLRTIRDGHYEKDEGEDMESIISGIRQWKGRVHITFNRPIGRDELESMESLPRNMRYQELGRLVDSRIQGGYAISGNNRAAYDMLHGTSTATPQEYDTFRAYLEKRISVLPDDCPEDEIRKYMLHLYSRPLENSLNRQ